MSLLEAIILGAVQGVTEWLPVSSSGHLALLQLSMGMEENVVMDAIVHLATLAVLLIHMRNDVISLFKGWLFSLKRKVPEGEMEEELASQGRVAWLVLLGTIPTAIIGFTMRDTIQEAFTSYTAVGAGLLFTAFLLVTIRINHVRNVRKAVETGQLPHEHTEVESNGFSPGRTIDWKCALLCGTMQGVAVFPGVSRSGSTITAGLLFGADRVKVLRFSLFLFIPAVIGANLVVLSEGLQGADPLELMVGFLVAAMVGYVCLRILEKVVVSGRMHWFAPYCFALGAIMVAYGLA